MTWHNAVWDSGPRTMCDCPEGRDHPVGDTIIDFYPPGEEPVAERPE